MQTDDINFQKEFDKLLEPIESTSDHSGASLKSIYDKRISELGLSERQVAQLLNIDRKTLNGILDRTAKKVDIVNAIKLSQFLNLKPENLLSLFLNDLSPDLIKDIERAKNLSFIISNFDLLNLKKANFIETKSDFDYIENRIKTFFGLSKITDYKPHGLSPAFSRTKRNSNDQMRDFWVESAYSHFTKIGNVNQFDRASLVELIPKIKPYTMNANKGLYKVIQALYNIGVTVIYQPHLPTVQVRGATFVIGKKPFIALTDLNKKYPNLWFALLHELYHVLYDFDEIEKRMYHLTGVPDLFLMEENADDFAREYLFSEDKSQYIAPFINDYLIVKEFAEENQIHPSIVYVYHQFYLSQSGDKLAWIARFKEHFPNISSTLKGINSNLWSSEKIDDSVKFIKENIFSIQ